jgi:hypothetical protein
MGASKQEKTITFSPWATIDAARSWLDSILVRTIFTSLCDLRQQAMTARLRTVISPAGHERGKYLADLGGSRVCSDLHIHPGSGFRPQVEHVFLASAQHGAMELQGQFIEVDGTVRDPAVIVFLRGAVTFGKALERLATSNAQVVSGSTGWRWPSPGFSSPDPSWCALQEAPPPEEVIGMPERHVLGSRVVGSE